MAINYTALAEIFGDTLPEAHIFFATREANQYVRSYQALRKEFGFTTAHTNRKIWKHFVKAYAENSTPKTITVEVTTGLTSQWGAANRLVVTTSDGSEPTFTFSNEDAYSVPRDYSWGTKAYDIMTSASETPGSLVVTATNATTGESVNVTITMAATTPITSITVEPSSMSFVKGVNSTVELTITTVPAEARNLVGFTASYSGARLEFDAITGTFLGKFVTADAASGELRLLDRTNSGTVITTVPITLTTS